MSKGTPLPPLDVARSLRLWEAWGNKPKIKLVAKQYEQSIARKEPPQEIVVDNTKSRAVRRTTIKRKR